MNKVYVIGGGLAKFGERFDKSFRELAIEASINAFNETENLEAKDIEAIYVATMASGRLLAQEHVGALIADQLGLNPIPSTRFEAACASGSVALRNAYIAIASGIHELIAVIGIEKMTEVSTEDVGTALGGAGDEESELFVGATFPAIYALMARRHMYEFGTTEEQMALCSVYNHKNGLHNQYAQYQKEITVEDVMNSGYIASPLKLLDCSPITDGAAIAFLASEKFAKKIKAQSAEIIASSQASDTIALANRKSFTAINATKVAAKDAFRQSKLEIKDIDVLELHDCFSIAEIMALEDLGFCKKGEGGKFVEEENIALNSKISVNTSGGLKAAGHPVGATGVKQIMEIFWQLNGKCGKRQVEDAEIGMTHNVGGSGGTVTTHVLKKIE